MTALTIALAILALFYVGVVIWALREEKKRKLEAHRHSSIYWTNHGRRLHRDE